MAMPLRDEQEPLDVIDSSLDELTLMALGLKIMLAHHPESDGKFDAGLLGLIEKLPIEELEILARRLGAETIDFAKYIQHATQE